MAQPVLSHVATPNCYGTSWKEADPRCNGGEDPLYLNPRTGKYERDACRFVDNCSTIVRSKQPQIIPPQALNRSLPVVVAQSSNEQANPFSRPPSAPTEVPRAQTAQVDTSAQLAAQQAQLAAQHAAHQRELQELRAQLLRNQTAAPTYVPPAQQQPYNPYRTQAAAAPTAPPAFQANYEIPTYLSRPEAWTPGTFLRRLAVEVFRSMAKGGGHTIASFFDHNPLLDPNDTKK